jgi:hypothetical protein
MHFSRYSANNGGVGVAYTADGFAAFNLPDLVFVDPMNGTCQIWEAKGRIGGVGGGFAAGGVPAVLNNALGQTRRVATLLVPGAGLVGPNARIASVARVRTGNRHWKVHVADPPSPTRPGSGGSGAQKDAFYAEFYRPFVQMVSSGTAVYVGGIAFVTQRLPGLDVKVGVDQRIVRLLGLTAGPRGNVSKQIESYIAQGYARQSAGRNTFVNRFGILTEAPDDDMTKGPAGGRW